MLGAILAALGGGGGTYGRATMREDEQEAIEQRRLQEITQRNEEIRANKLAAQQEAEAAGVRDREAGMASYRLMFPNATIPNKDADPRLMAQLQGQREASMRAAEAEKGRNNRDAEMRELRVLLENMRQGGQDRRQGKTIGAQGDRWDDGAPRRDQQVDAGREALFNRKANSAVMAAGGNEQRAIQALLDDPNTTNIFSQGMDSRHIRAAVQAHQQRANRPSYFPPSQPVAPNDSVAKLLGRPAGR